MSMSMLLPFALFPACRLLYRLIPCTAAIGALGVCIVDARALDPTFVRLTFISIFFFARPYRHHHPAA
jgi:hypothetical protein